MVKQLSIFMENSRGSMLKAIEAISEAGVSILSNVTNDSAEYGIIRLIVDNPEAALEALTKKGYLSRINYVCGVVLEDEPGALTALLKTIDTMNVNLNYMYMNFDRKLKRPVAMINGDSISIVEESLKQKGYRIYNI